MKKTAKALDLFRLGYSTYQISKRFDVHEARVYNAIHSQREFARAQGVDVRNKAIAREKGLLPYAGASR